MTSGARAMALVAGLAAWAAGPAGAVSAPDGGVAPEPAVALALPAPAQNQEVAAETPEQPPAADAGFQTTVRAKSEAQRLRESAQAVKVVETRQARRQSADLGEVLARTEGVAVQRTGGLGSGTRLSLNGLTDDQIRFFLDGLPLDLAGYPFGLSNVPVNLVDRVEIYRGVVPVRFGADALGGAVNLVSEPLRPGPRGALSYELGSHQTHRVTLAASDRDASAGTFVRGTGFFDAAENDYPVDVETWDPSGQLSPARVSRFHDGYQAGGGSLETGVVGRSWARRLAVRGFITGFARELQHDLDMQVPYGEAALGRTGLGATLFWSVDLPRELSLDVSAGYAFERTWLLDVSRCVYDWYGRCAGQRPQPGEVEGVPHDQVIWGHSGFGRVNLEWRPRSQHTVRLSVAPTYVTRTGDERQQRNPSARDPLTARKDLFTLVAGAEHELQAFDGRLDNVAFAKGYLQLVRGEEALLGGFFRDRSRDSKRAGVGDALRFRFADPVWAKLSYEWATRLPRPDEVFGDGGLVQADLDLVPESSHNLNAGVTVDARDTRAGSFRLDLHGFLREASQLIVLLGNDRFYSYHNVYSARSLGVEAAAGWTEPHGYLALDANVTYVDFRNTSATGSFADYAGDRVPNRPYLFANAAARGQLRELAMPGDELALSYSLRYVHDYFRGWESVGIHAYKQRVPEQLLHSLALTYLFRLDTARLTASVEAQNLTDEPAFDVYGVQRPGRTFRTKLTCEL
ncbi:MAG: TonB-dependent siderophore myxochelin receptor MxcH [Myxococcales bacterium]